MPGTAPTMQASWAEYGAVIVVPNLADAIPLCDRLAPEHLQLAVDAADADALFGQVRHAGSVFLGSQTPAAIGDYVAGPNHVPPTPDVDRATAETRAGTSIHASTH